jgi:hypothetical protein
MTRARVPSRRGITTVELLIAIAITAVTGLAIATVTTSLARGITATNESRSALQRALAAHTRYRAYVEPCLSVLDFDPDRGFALWLHDDRSNGQVNVSELRVFWYDGTPDGEATMERVVWPDAWDEPAKEAADITLSGVDNYFDAMETQRGLGYTETVVMIDGLSGQSVAHDASDIAEADRVRVELDVQVGTFGTERIMVASGLPNHRIPE